jgi:hypothetical protein
VASSVASALKVRMMTERLMNALAARVEGRMVAEASG